jgi:phosphatidylinositol glycan class B
LYNKKIILSLLIAVTYGLTVFYSTGYHHPDEHFQLIEFAGLKGGWNTGTDLPWEYDSQIRPALQPVLALLIFKFQGIFGIENPLSLAMGLRLFTALLSLFCIRRWVRSVTPDIREPHRRVFILLSYLLWFLPAINVRFSSETWAGLMLLLSVAGLYQACPRTRLFYIAIGVLWGLSFEFRYQMAAALLGLFLWLIFVRKEKYKHLLSILSGSMGVLLCSTLLDSWYYGNWVFAPWNYFKCNIIDGVASHFGTLPWYFYLEAIVTRPTPLIGYAILFSFLLLFFDYKNILLWCLLPFLLIHSLIPHKELRFLFPVVNFLPFILMLAYQKIRRLWNSPSARYILYPVVGMVLLINTGGLAMMTFKPANFGKTNMVKYLREQYAGAEINLYTLAYSNPYSEGAYKGLFARFYANDKVKIKNLSDVIRLQSLQKLNNDDRIILMAGYHERSYIEKQGFVIEKRSIPLWIEKMNRLYQVYPDYCTLLLYSNPDDKKN